MPKLCSACATREAMVHATQVVGPAVLREDHLCEQCASVRDEQTPGPIDWDTLRASLPNIERESGATAAHIAKELRRIATHHAQHVPEDVARFIDNQTT